MSKVNELTYDVREAIKEFIDDTELDDRYIIYLYNIKRAKYLRQDLNNYLRTNDNSILQTLCLEVEKVSEDECGFITDCKYIMRTKQPIPTPLELHTKVAITKVKPTNKTSIPFNFITKDKVPYISGSMFSSSIYAFLDNDNYIYLVSNNNSYFLLECISVTGVFEDPLELSNYSNCCGCTSTDSTCFDIDATEYPLQPHYVDLIRKEIVNDLIFTKNIPEDRENNSTDEEIQRR